MLTRMELPFTQEELRRMGIWLDLKDIHINISSRPEGDAYHFSYTPKVVSSFLIDREMQMDIETDPTLMNDMMEECLLAMQEVSEKCMIDHMIRRSYGSEAYMYPTKIHTRGKKRWLSLNPKFFPSYHIKNNDILILTSSQVYHRIISAVMSGENPDALIGKIEWTDAPRFIR